MLLSTFFSYGCSAVESYISLSVRRILDFSLYSSFPPFPVLALVPYDISVSCISFVDTRISIPILCSLSSSLPPHFPFFLFSYHTRTAPPYTTTRRPLKYAYIHDSTELLRSSDCSVCRGVQVADFLPPCFDRIIGQAITRTGSLPRII